METSERVRSCVSLMQLFCKGNRVFLFRTVGSGQHDAWVKNVRLTSPPLSDHNVNSGNSRFFVHSIFPLSCYPSMAFSSFTFPHSRCPYGLSQRFWAENSTENWTLMVYCNVRATVASSRLILYPGSVSNLYSYVPC